MAGAVTLGARVIKAADVRTRIPVSVEEMKTRLGMRSPCWGTLEEVHAAQGAVADWVLDAAHERWPELEHAEELELMTRALENARELWPGFEEFTSLISHAERVAIRKMGPMA